MIDCVDASIPASQLDQLFHQVGKRETHFPDYQQFDEAFRGLLEHAYTDRKFIPQAQFVMQHALYFYLGDPRRSPKEILREEFGVSVAEKKFGLFDSVAGPKVAEQFRDRHSGMLRFAKLL